MQKYVILCKEKLENIYVKDKKYRKVRDHWHYTRKHICCAWHMQFKIWLP